MTRRVLTALFLGAWLAVAQRIQVRPADVTVDYRRVDMVEVPGERPIQALVISGAGPEGRLYGISENRFLVLEGGRMRIAAELPSAVRTLVALPGNRFLAGRYVIDKSGQVLRDYGLEDVHAATAGLSGQAYAVTYPDGQFYALGERAVPQGRLYERSLIGVDEHFRAVPRALAVDNSGAVWASGELGFLYRYSAGKLAKTELRLPAEKGREFLNVVECFAADPSGVLYGGTSDGYLFRLDPARLTIENLGKPASLPRIRTLAVQRDGSLLGMAGDQLFIYRSGVYELLGRLEYWQPDKLRWMAYDIDSMAIGPDGTAYFGESQFRAHLFLLRPRK